MKFNYQDFSAVPFNGYRFYDAGRGHFYPSITTVLGKTISADKEASLEAWRNGIGHDEADRITKDAASHGTNVHLLIERHLKGEPLVQQGDEFSDKDIGAFNGLKMKLSKIDEVWGQEVALYSAELGVAGRCDCVGVYKGVPSIIDFKTSRKVKSDEMIGDYKLQLCAYSIMHNEMFGTNITNGVVLMSTDGGFPQEFIVPLEPQKPLLKQRVDKFYEILASAR